MGKQFKFDETAFKPKQREVALALVEREFIPKEDRLTKEEIAQEHGISHMTLYRWQKQDPNFISYMGHLASQFMDSNQSKVYAKLMEAVNKGNIKAMELYMKRSGDLDTKNEISFTQNQDELSIQDRLDRLKARKDAALAAKSAAALGGGTAIAGVEEDAEPDDDGPNEGE